MTITAKVAAQVSKFKDGTTFTYEELQINREEYPGAAKAIERLLKKGIVSRVSTGLFYKPRKTAFGTLQPNEQDLLRPYLYENGKRVAYITGLALYNKLGLTTQVPKNIKLTSRDKRIAASVGSLKIRSVKSYTDITEENYQYLELLDVIKDFKTIPDIDSTTAIQNITGKLKKLGSLKIFKALALKYPPRVRAFAGAILQQIAPKVNLDDLKTSLNPLSQFKFGINTKQLSTITNWNII
ncbi:MAG: DUF6088 family protein [Chitinophagaceae bacterium]